MGGECRLNSKIEELTLMLLYLTAWDEEVPPFGTHKRSWKGYNKEVLDNLDGKGLIVGSNKSKTVFLTDEGAARAMQLVNQYLQDRIEIFQR